MIPRAKPGLPASSVHGSRNGISSAGCTPSIARSASAASPASSSGRSSSRGVRTTSSARGQCRTGIGRIGREHPAHPDRPGYTGAGFLARGLASRGLVPDPAWPGEVVRDALGLVLGPDEGAVPVEDVVGLALRRNPRRAHLPVSRVLGKHLPTEPRRTRAAADDLADTIRRCLAETATPRGRARRARVRRERHRPGPPRRRRAGRRPRRAHHAAGRRRRVGARRPRRAAQPRAAARARARRPGRWTPDRPLVLVDDELTTGRTAATTLRLLHQLLPRRRYLVATLADLRGHSDDAVDRVAHDLGVRIDVVASARSRLDLPPDVLDRAAHLSGPGRTAPPDPRGGPRR